MNLRVNLLGRYNGVVAVAVEDPPFEGPIEGVSSEPVEDNNGTGQIWMYRQHPVLLPANSAFSVKLQFGSEPRVKPGDWVILEGEGHRDGKVGQVLQIAKDGKTAIMRLRIVEPPYGKNFIANTEHLRVLSELELLALESEE